MNNIQIFLLPALILGLTLFVPVQLIAGEYQATRVIDGDTIKIEDGSKKITVRLAGIDAPETSNSMTCGTALRRTHIALAFQGGWSWSSWGIRWVTI